jgi:hypothetical protein
MLAIAARRSTIIAISNPSFFGLSFHLGHIWENSHIIPKLKLIWDIFGKIPISFSYASYKIRTKSLSSFHEKSM